MGVYPREEGVSNLLFSVFPCGPGTLFVGRPLQAFARYTMCCLPLILVAPMRKLTGR